MSNYSGQEGGELKPCVKSDGAELFGPSYPRKLKKHVDDNTLPSQDILDKLVRLATQDPPSHQAQYYLDKLKHDASLKQVEQGSEIEQSEQESSSEANPQDSGLLPDYDEIVGQSWKLNPKAAEALLATVGLKPEPIGDNR